MYRSWETCWACQHEMGPTTLVLQLLQFSSLFLFICQSYPLYNFQPALSCLAGNNSAKVFWQPVGSVGWYAHKFIFLCKNVITIWSMQVMFLVKENSSVPLRVKKEVKGLQINHIQRVVAMMHGLLNCNHKFLSLADEIWGQGCNRRAVTITTGINLQLTRDSEVWDDQKIWSALLTSWFLHKGWFFEG